MQNSDLIEIKNLFVEYRTKKGILGGEKIIHAVNGVNLEIKKGEILAIAGESGCGKSTLAKALIKLEPVKSGEIMFEGLNILTQNKKELKEFRKHAQMVFQNPYASLNPKMKIGEILKEPLIINTKLSKQEISAIIKEKIKLVGLNENCLDLYPHEFSGGQRQRIAIARALVLDPEFILADEPVSALDVSIQAQVINLIKGLKENYNLTFLLITHDMSVIEYLADRVAIMYLGEIVELGSTKEIFSNPYHPYTKALYKALPNHDFVPIDDKTQPLPNELPKGCVFSDRCPLKDKNCENQVPKIREIRNGKVRCIHAT